MIQRMAKHSVWMLEVLVIGLSAAALYAAPQMANDQTAGSQTVTGCLQKGLETKGFFIVDSDGKHWELYPDKSVSLGDHVGHTVTVTGILAKRTAAQEVKSQPYEKKEITGKEHSDLQVSGLKMVSDSCTK